MFEIISKDKTYPRQSQVEIKPYATNEEILENRFQNIIGRNITVPETAMNSKYIDKKCPFTGEISIRGRIFKGKVIKMKAEKTIVVRVDYLHYDTKYKRFARRNSKFNVHLSPCFLGLVKIGDNVVCGECRPISKTKSSCVIAVEKAEDTSNVKVFKKL